MAFDCPKNECIESFDTETGAKIHHTRAHGHEYDDPELLNRLYHEKGMTTYEIAEKFDVVQGAIANAMDRYDIDRRHISECLSGRRSKNALYRINGGYMEWVSTNGKEPNDKMYVHRLLAVAEYGMDAVKDKHVHHKNGVKWDNRPGNIEVMNSSDHLSMHTQERWESGEMQEYNE